MKYLINSELTAVMKGEFVKADEESGEFIFDTDNVTFSKATIIGIADANNIKIPAKMKSQEQIILFVIDELSALKIGEVSKMTQSDLVKEIVQRGFEEGREDNDILVELVNNGISFKNAVKFFNQAIATLGLRITIKDIQEKVNALVDEVEWPENYEGFFNMATWLHRQIEGATDKQILICLKRYAKKYEKPVFKSETGAIPKVKSRMFAWMIENPNATEPEFTKFVVEDLGRKEIMAKNWYPVFDLAKQMATKL